MQVSITHKSRFSSFIRSRLMGISSGVFILATSLIIYYDVEKTITGEDLQYIPKFIPAGVPKHAAQLRYPQQLQALRQVQRNLMQIIEVADGLPAGLPGEPKDLFLRHKGLCYNRSRALEKIYMYMGFATRHVSIYVDVPNKSVAQELLQSGSPSHAVLEVKTAKGWLVVDSNAFWIALDQQKQPYSMQQIREAKGHINWAGTYPKGWEHYYDGSAFFIYGLYSRHGQFYPPFTRGIPDYNLRELTYNL